MRRVHEQTDNLLVMMVCTQKRSITEITERIEIRDEHELEITRIGQSKLNKE
ncbi:MAG: hypothetical protein GY820_19080 [Gammaproteobacteria bacterium]|nr:hypothetical protein [Gammaproteobacteria bacterium]